MSRAGIDVKGVPELVKSLGDVAVEIADLHEAFTSIADRGARLAASFAPSRTGRLKASIKGSTTENRASVEVGVRYGSAINYGYPKRNIAPQHFLQKADQAIASDIIPTIEAEIGSILKEKGLT